MRLPVLLLVSCAAAIAQPKFEAASIRPLQGNSFAAGIAINGNRVTASGPLKHMLTSIYGVRSYQISGGPRWADEDLYIVSAVTDPSVTPTMDQARSMLRALFEERFHLKVGHALREMQVYALLVDSGGPKIQPAAPEAQFDLSIGMEPSSKLEGTLSLTSLTYQLNQFAHEDRPILDLTGLTGLYKVRLEWASTAQTAGDAPSLFTAVKEQLGLRLEARRAPVEMIAIESVQRPTEN